MTLNTVDDACDFIAEWTGVEGTFAGATLPSEPPIPQCIRALNSRLGLVWQGSEHPFWMVHTEGAGPVTLFDVQDHVLDPRTFALDDHGIIPVLWENQGVFGFGFDPNTDECLYVCRDWCDGLESEFPTTWRKAGATLEDGIVSALLGNLWMLNFGDAEVELDELAPKPSDASELLWLHPAWRGFDGFWTDTGRTLFYYSGMGTLRRAP